jgi:hypothetical protein
LTRKVAPRVLAAGRKPEQYSVSIGAKTHWPRTSHGETDQTLDDPRGIEGAPRAVDSAMNSAAKA